MDDTEITYMKHSRMNAVRTGKCMGVFSIVTLFVSIVLVGAGLFLLFYGNTLPDNMPHYIDNILGVMGIAFIVVAMSLVPVVVKLRRVAGIAKQLKVSSDLSPIKGFVRANYEFWRYATRLLIVLFVMMVLFAVALYIYLLPTLSTL